MARPFGPVDRAEDETQAFVLVIGSLLLAAFVAIAAVMMDVEGQHLGGMNTALAVSGVVFSIYVLAVVYIAGARWPLLTAVALFGLTFPLWGTLGGLLLWFLGGWFGIPQALGTGVVLWSVTRSGLPMAASVLGLSVGWLIVLVVSNDHMYDILVVTWNVFMAGSLVLWVMGGGVIGPRRDPGACARCGYNLSGNVLGRCSECGTSISPVKPSSPG